jgi:deazaflavin-dependent oxidoreductase (nitroreductase family)
LNKAIHTWLYRRSGGKLGARRNGLPVLLLTTTGRFSGKLHTTPVVYLADGEDYVIMPGVYARPDWYLNLKAHPQAAIQVGPEQIPVAATITRGYQRDRLWQFAPSYWHDYQAQYRHPLPIISLTLSADHTT